MGGAGVGLAVFLVFFLAKGMGGGDVKLMAGFGSLLGPRAILWAAWTAAVVGGLMALACAGVGMLRQHGSPAGRSRAIPEAIPYAPAIVAGVWFTQYVLA